MRYLKISFLLDATVGDEATAALAEAGLPCERCDQTTLDKPPPGQVQLNLYADPGSSTQGDAEAALAEAGLAAQVEVAECDDGAWQDRWKDYFRPRPIGRFVIVPSWESYTASGAEVVLDLDPGRAFGTGGHASTRLCLVAISTLGRGQRFLDVGCGSGVLAIACARLWPEATGLAIDVDPEAVEVTRENAERNGVAARLTASTAPLHRVQGSFDLVLANIQAEVIEPLAEELARRVAPGGRLIASGILRGEADRVAARLVEQGLLLGGRLDEEDWQALILERP